MPELKIGEKYNLVADYVLDKKWGEQYNIISIFNTIIFDENDVNSQRKFLETLFTQLQIVNMYTALDNPYVALKNKDVKQLVKVKGCGFDTALRWIDRFHENVHIGKIFTELSDYNLTNNMIQRLIQKYKTPEIVIDKVKNNPYILCTEVKGIGWKTADQIALSGGIYEYSKERISSYIYNYLDSCGQNGYSMIDCDELMGEIIEFFGEEIPDNNITEAIHFIEDKLWWSEDKVYIGLKYYYNLENNIASELIRIRNAKTDITYNDNWLDSVKHIEYRQGWQFNKEQLDGVKQALDNNVIVIHGEAGTGKTSLVSALLEVLKSYKYVQCALSGRASSRMAEVTGEEGYTIHRLLGYPDTSEENKNGFKFHDENPLDVDIIILDEISMVNASLFYYLLRAIPSGAKLICLGDMGQLESIGEGNIAYDMIHSEEIPTIYLSQVHRQAQSSAIVMKGRDIRKGIPITEKDWVGTQTMGELQDLIVDCYSDKSNTFYKIVQYFSEEKSKENFNVLETQIIVPLKDRGDACCYNINNTVQELCNPPTPHKKEITTWNKGKATILRAGDKVINLQNNYKTNFPIYNGNIGIIEDIDLEEEILIINFMGIGTVYIPRDHISSIALGYCITTHKSQGSQFNTVIFGIDYNSYSLLSRGLLYTGITRAKEKCYLIAQKDSLRMAVNTEKTNIKTTHLQSCLYENAHPKLIF